MKKIAFLSLLILFISNGFSTAIAAPLSSSITLNKELSANEFKRINSRVYEIRKMDFNKLSASEKKLLKKELKEMKNQLAWPDGGIYISAGALIVILILLIILL